MYTSASCVCRMTYRHFQVIFLDDYFPACLLSFTHRFLLEPLTLPETGEGNVSASFYPIPLVNRFVLFLLIGKAPLLLTFLLSNLKQTYFLLCKNPLPPSGYGATARAFTSLALLMNYRVFFDVFVKVLKHSLNASVILQRFYFSDYHLFRVCNVMKLAVWTPFKRRPKPDVC